MLLTEGGADSGRSRLTWRCLYDETPVVTTGNDGRRVWRVMPQDALSADIDPTLPAKIEPKCTSNRSGSGVSNGLNGIPTITAREALASTWLILFFANSRALTQDERVELGRLCNVLKQGIQTRQIYNATVYRFCDGVRRSGVIEKGVAENTAELLEAIEGLQLLVG